MQINEEQIRKSISMMKDGVQPFEIRIIANGSTYSGYFDNADNLIGELINFPDEKCNVYMTLNLLNNACMARTQSGRLIRIKRESTTSDNDVIGYRWLLIDLDPQRPSDTSSSNEELEQSKELGKKVKDFMKQVGFNEPLIAESGNGYHLLYKIEMANTKDNAKLIEKCLKVLDMYFSTDLIKIDTSVFNPSRICKLYGTVARKGLNTEDRPHRLSRLFGKEGVPVPVNDISYVKKLASMYPEQQEKPQKYNNYSPRSFDVRSWLDDKGLRYKESSWNGGRKFVLDCCPFDSSHKGKDAAVFQMTSGCLGFRCLHNSCAEKGWKDLRILLEPTAYDYKNQERDKSFYQSFNRNKKPEPKSIVEKDGNPVFLNAMDILNLPKKHEKFVKTGITEIDRYMRGLKKEYVSLISGLRGCVDCDTEFFTGTGWKKISEYVPGDKVLQYNEDGTAKLVKPLKYHKYQQDVLHRVKTRALDMCLSKNHNVVYVTSKGNLAKKMFGDVMDMHQRNKVGFSGKFITTFKRYGRGIPLSDEEIRVMCMIICDGHFPRKTNYCRINLKRKRKIERCHKLLKDAGIDYRVAKYNPHDLDFDTFLFNAPLRTKKLDDFWYGCNKHQMEVIVDEIYRWDGYIDKHGSIKFSQVEKDTIDFLQYIHACLGHHASVRSSIRDHYKNGIIYHIHVYKGSKLVGIVNADQKIPIEEYRTTDGYMYCFSVPSAMLVLRRNGKIFVTGNSAKSTMLSQMALRAIDDGNNVGIYSGELSPRNFMRWMNLQAAGRGNVEVGQYEGYYNVPWKVQKEIASWMGEHFWLYNNEYGNNFKSIIERFEKEINDKKLDMLILDNLMAFNISDLGDTKWDAQTEFVLSLKRLAVKYEVAIVFVAHPRKAMGFLRLDDVSGSGDLSNAVDNAFIVHRNNRDFRRLSSQMFGWKEDNEIYQSTNCIEIAKDRDGGIQDKFIPLWYEKETKRLKNDPTENIIYGWDADSMGFVSMEIAEEESPFD